MKTPSFRPVGALAALALLALLPPGLRAESGLAAVSWYTGGEASLSLQPVAATVEYRLDLAGTTRMRTLVLKLARSGSADRQITLPVRADGSFAANLLLKDGPGNYTATLFGSPQAGALSFAGIGYFKFSSTAPVPADLPGLFLNDKVLAYVDSVMGQTVGRGECWDLAQEALDRNGADWTRPLRYGLPLDPKRQDILPGDIIQFRSVRIETKLPGGGRQWETLGAPDHTAVIRAVLGPNRYRLAHQNLGGKRFVQLTELDLGNMTGGQYWIWRPVAGMFFP